MNRRAFVAGFGTVFAAPLIVQAQRAAKVYRIGLLATSPAPGGGVDLLAEFLRGLEELGYQEGRNVVVERRYSYGRDEQLTDLVAELVRLKANLIVASATQPVHAARRATTTIPIVMPNHSDPVGAGIIKRLAHPGGNGRSMVRSRNARDE